MVVPPPLVLAEFGAGPGPAPLKGGQGTAWRSGDVVLKPLDMSAEALEWQAKVLESASSDAFRLAPPLRSRAGALVVEGWTAWPLLAGRTLGRWADIVAVGERFHDALESVKRPDTLLDNRTDMWAQADRIAWGELPAGKFMMVPEVADLVAARGPATDAGQLVHGDLTGNVLFADGLPPAIIDFSPYWRPKAYASAIVAADAVVWCKADLGLLSTVVDGDEGTGPLVRALLFRLLADPDPAAHAIRFRPAVDHVLRLSDA